MPHSRQNWPLVVLLLITLLPVSYMGAYYVMLNGIEPDSSSEALPDYHFSDLTARKVFWLAHEIDRAMRPRYWGN